MEFSEEERERRRKRLRTLRFRVGIDSRTDELEARLEYATRAQLLRVRNMADKALANSEVA